MGFHIKIHWRNRFHAIHPVFCYLHLAFCVGRQILVRIIVLDFVNDFSYEWTWIGIRTCWNKLVVCMSFFSSFLIFFGYFVCGFI